MPKNSSPKVCFNPRSRVGSDRPSSGGRSKRRGFQSTLPRGERPCLSLRNRRMGWFQSTLPRGERLLGMLQASMPSGFQSTLPRGERPCLSLRNRRMGWFQSTLPRGERLLGMLQASMPSGFQSTLPRGERLGHPFEIQFLGVVSIHAPAWGATCLPEVPSASIVSFNPRSRVGSDVQSGKGDPETIRFNPRSRVGSDRPFLGVSPADRVSIHAPAWGATRGLRLRGRPRFRFNPRSRVGSDVQVAEGISSFWRFQSTLPRGERRP